MFLLLIFENEIRNSKLMDYIVDFLGLLLFMLPGGNEVTVRLPKIEKNSMVFLLDL